jgi:general secretion pathway protein G
MKKRSTGFTLIEVMVVVVILAILASLIVPKIMSRPEEARLIKAKQDILAIQSALDLYQLDNAIYPTTEQGLKALVEKPSLPPVPEEWKEGGYLAKLPIDPWGQAYQYTFENDKVRVFSYGPKGQEGNSEINND